MIKEAITLACIFISSSLYGIVTFDDAMSIHEQLAQPFFLTQQLMFKARIQYEWYNPEIVPVRNKPVIPKIIHHVWLGKPLSQEDKQLRKTWYKFHPGWRFVLWTDRTENDSDAFYVDSWDGLRDALMFSDETFILVDVARLQFGNRSFFDEAINYGERSDILKYEIVYQVGGMYVDCDFECLKPFDDLFDRYDFFTGIQPRDTSVEQLGAALFAAKPNHPVLRYAVETIEEDHHFQQIVIKSGPIHFSRAFIAAAGQDGNIDVAFPASFFYPCGYNQQNLARSVWMRPESYAVHHWAGSWLVKEAFVGN